MSVPRATEMTVRSLLLRELERRGVKVNPEISFSTPVGRMMPDAVLQNGGDYVVETKLGAEARLFDALLRLHDYSKYTEARGAFAILFPEGLRRPMPPEALTAAVTDPALTYMATAIFKDLRPTQRFSGNFSKMVDWITEHVLKPPVVEPDTSLAIRVLSDAVEYITDCTQQLKGKELEDIFGGRTVFENILQYEEGRYPLEAMRRAATYLLINQILFYHVLSRTDRRYPPIDDTKLQKPGDLAGYFNEVLKVDYTSTFGFDVASRFPDSATDMLRKVVRVVDVLAPEKIRHDVLGKVFHELIPFDVRKAVAAFYTNNEAAEVLAQLSIDDPHAKVSDLAVGSGTLLVAAYRRKRDLLLKSKGHFGLEDHKRFLEEDLTGVDVMPFAAHLAMVHLSLQALLYESEKVRIAVWDSTELNPGKVIPAVARELRRVYERPTLDLFMEGQPSSQEVYVKKGVITLEGVGGEEIPLEQADVVIMNPPFTRQERLPTDYKAALMKRFQEYEDYLHGQLGLHGYFVLLADRFLRERGRMALVLPATILRVRSFEGLRKLWSEKYHIEHIVTTWHRSAFSESVRFRELLLVASKSTPRKDDKTTIIVLKRLPSTLAEAREAAEQTKASKKDWEDDKIAVKIHDYAKLKSSTDNWFKYIAVSDMGLIDLFEELSKSEKLTTLSSIASLIRGFELRGGSVTSLIINTKEDRAIKSGDIWLLSESNETSVRFRHKAVPTVKFRIPSGVTRRTLRRASGVSRIDVTQELDNVIVQNWNREEFGRFENAVGTRLTDGLLTALRTDVERRLGNLFLVRRMNLSAPRTSALAFYSSTEAAPTKLMWSLNVPDEHGKILATYLNSTINLLQALLLRAETEGAFIELSEYILDDFLVVDPSKLSLEERNMLLGVFDNIKDVELPSILDQLRTRHSSRRLIDTAWLKVLGFKGDIDNLLDRLYESLTNEIELLKRLMAEGEVPEETEE